YYGFGKFGSKSGLYIAVQHNFDLSMANGGLALYLSSKHIVNAVRAVDLGQIGPAVQRRS
ncbi:MAG: hypothetical protein FJ100_23700, partial [Deltaproteobacteria bacterium]|nr:hypothetical protein [Deltaproteobacteria bacterium]